MLLVNGALSVKGNSVRIRLQGLGDILFKQELKFELKANNNQVEYETLIADTVLALEMGASRLKAKNGSQLVSN